MIRREALVRGTVQGVGFRPAVARLASELGLGGFVRNEGGVVRIAVEGSIHAVDVFALRLPRELPVAARIESITWVDVPRQGAGAFEVVTSTSGPARPAIPPDLVTCAACLAEVRDLGDRRFGYLFTNCTACGPRFTIVERLPYDRVRTSMRAFPMCALCAAEYADIADRRYHAEPIACPTCGPRLGPGALEAALDALRAGQIVALKGLGGWQLLCDATDEVAVRRLRERKRRPRKPFAVLVSDLQVARTVACVSDAEAAVLRGADGPIVLLRSRGWVADSVAPDLARVGLMLPTTPLHHALAADGPLVCTSGNVSDEPLAVTDDEALRDLEGVADVWLGHDRPIVRRCDDAVVRIIDGRARTLRLGRGRAPTVVHLAVGPELLAVGGHLKCAPAAAIGDEAVLWPHVGDLDGPRSRAALRDAVQGLTAFLDLRPVAIAHDAHPDYGSTRVAEALGLPRIAVHHHHAHVASVMAEHGLVDALGFAWDGTGLGPDGTAWGGEVLRVDRSGAGRVAWLRPFPLPGGDAAARDGRRALAGALVAADLPVPEALLAHARVARASGMTTSAGRLFDAVAALLGICEHSGYEGEAATRLEDRATPDAEPLPFALDGRIIDWRPALAALVDETDAGRGASRFHATLAAMITAVAVREGVADVVLSGGCFQNAIFAEGAARRLRAAGLRPWLAERAPIGDGGLALGQLQVARWRLLGQ